ncbi:hypothetical protein PanWU01x14_127330, partial [Parasponia andersonii]
MASLTGTLVSSSCVQTLGAPAPESTMNISSLKRKTFACKAFPLHRSDYRLLLLRCISIISEKEGKKTKQNKTKKPRPNNHQPQQSAGLYWHPQLTYPYILFLFYLK